jgi:aspartate/methionine/tyrosine aminotransferase
MATNSAASAMYLVARAAITSPGQEALIFDPVDFLFERSVVAAGGRVVRIPLAKAGWTFDPDLVESLIVPGKTRLLGVCNPHNPCGRVWTRDELLALADIAVRHDLLILSDEVWADIVYPPHRLTSIASLNPQVAARTYSVYGFSKGYGLAGLRVGLVACPSEAARNHLVRLSHADETAYGVSTLSQVAAMAAWRDAGDWLARFLAHLEAQRDYAVRRLNAIPGVRCQAPQGTFVVFPDVSTYALDPVVMVHRLLEHHRVAVVPGSARFFGPGALGHLRIAFGTSRGVLREGLDRVERGLAAIRSGS